MYSLIKLHCLRYPLGTALFVLQSPQLNTPFIFLSYPVVDLQPNLTYISVPAEIERVIQSNHKFRLNDMVVIVNLVIHVEMANGGIGTKRSEVILETLIWLKRIQLFAFETPTKFV